MPGGGEPEENGPESFSKIKGQEERRGEGKKQRSENRTPDWRPEMYQSWEIPEGGF